MKERSKNANLFHYIFGWMLFSEKRLTVNWTEKFTCFSVEPSSAEHVGGFLDIWGFCRCLASMPMGILAHIPMWLLWLFFKLFYFMNFISASLSCCSFIDDMCLFSICSVLHRETSSSCVRWWWWYVAQKDGLWWVQMLARSLCSSHQLVIDKFLLLLCGKLTRVILAQCRTWNETE